MKEKSQSSDSGDKALWELLGAARKPKAGPMFARNVLREIRQHESKSNPLGDFFAWLQKPAILVGGAAAILVAGFLVMQTQESKVSVAEVTDSETESVETIDPAMEFESIEMLGELMAVSDPALLSDEALMNLLF